MRQLCSSFFKFSYLKRPHVDSDSIAEYKADSELNCALRCNTRGNCDEATFNRESKKCSLYKMKDKATIGSNTRDDNSRSRTVTMSKRIVVTNIFLAPRPSYNIEDLEVIAFKIKEEINIEKVREVEVRVWIRSKD
ncbi:hypothetical protein ACROYT_G008946 [Oculina patagonica]